MPAPHPVLHHMLKAGTLRGNWATRSFSNARATAELFAHGIDIETLEELSDLQQAAWQRLWALQSGWLQGWKSWLRYADQIKGANTMAKLVERDGNITAQFTQLLGNQVTDLVGLAENIQVDYAYWINEKLNARRKSEAAAGSAA